MATKSAARFPVRKVHKEPTVIRHLPGAGLYLKNAPPVEIERHG